VGLAKIEGGRERVNGAAMVGAEIEDHAELLVRLRRGSDQVLGKRER
jgi:hypothetical protein